MRLTKRRHGTMPDLNMTPMIDVVFQLLIFFMTVSQQVSVINTEGVQLPKLKGSEDQQRKTLTVNVTRDGQLRVSGSVVTMAGLVGMVAREQERVGGDNSLLTVVVRADERGTSQIVNDVLESLGRLGIRQIRLAVQKPQR